MYHLYIVQILEVEQLAAICDSPEVVREGVDLEVDEGLTRGPPADAVAEGRDITPARLDGQ